MPTEHNIRAFMEALGASEWDYQHDAQTHAEIYTAAQVAEILMDEATSAERERMFLIFERFLDELVRQNHWDEAHKRFLLQKFCYQMQEIPHGS